MENLILSDPAASYWLKEQIEKTKERDCVDVLNDIEVLRNVILERINNKCPSGYLPRK